MDPNESVQTGLQHHLHDHMLVLHEVADLRGYINCKLCYRRINGDDDLIIYGCKECGFFLHKSCAKIPRYVHNSLHPMHALEFFRFENAHGYNIECKLCYRRINGDDDLIIYGCKECGFFLHKSCAEIRCYVHNSLHPMHRLEFFQFENAHGYNIHKCGFCKKIIRSRGYKCGRGCDFTLHIECANRSIFETKDHEHSFIILKPTLFTCDACGIDEDSKCCSCLCYTCLLQVHPSCREELFPLSPSVRQIMHPHELKLCYSFEIGFDFTHDFCKICSRKMNNVLCLYQCKDDAGCAYIVHTSCANSKYLLTENIDQDHGDYGHVDINTLLLKEEVEPADKETKTHFSHPHSLILSDILPTNEDGDVYAICYGCVRPVSVPFYTCGGMEHECSFFLHKQCFELPKTIQGPIHQHPLVLKDFLDMEMDDKVFHGFTCEACGCRCNGFVYQCKECEETFDVGCASFGATLNHESHKCTLTLISKYFNDGNHRCNACDSTFATAAFCCEKCTFFLDLKCASFPKTVGHDCPTGTVWSIKPLKLTYDCIEHAGGQYYCDLCGETRGKDEWFYHCGDCHDSIHPQCLLGVGRFMYGKSYNLDGHCHTVRVVKKPKTLNTFCDTCKKPCTDSLPLLFCPTCKVYFHCDFDCCDISFTDEGKPIKNYSCDLSSSPEKSEEEEDDDNEDQELAEEQVLHFGHPHNLSLRKYDPESSLCNEVCDGCVMPIISAPAFYTCAYKKGKCNFFLHKECFELPEQIQHPFHSDHPLVLKSLLDLPGNEGYGFNCYACETFSNGFTYTCLECEIFLDVRCSLLSDTLVHESHKCPLTLIDKHIQQEEEEEEEEEEEDSASEVERKCDACNSNCCWYRCICDECNVEIGLQCALLPKEMKHSCKRYDGNERPQYLRYGGNIEGHDGSRKYICNKCSYSTYEDEWLYYCEDCCDTTHPRCTTIRSNLIKSGIVYRAYNHFHKLTTVTIEVGEYCQLCNEHDVDICATSEHMESSRPDLYCATCNVKIHFECCRQLRRVS